MLIDYITSEAIQLQIQVENWEAAVRTGGELLVQCGYCESRYVDAMIAAVHDMGPYMVMAPGIALAHARPEDGMLKPGMSIVNLKNPVEFGSEENDPVYLVISFGGVDKEGHVEMLRALAQFLMDESHQDLLKTATSVEELIAAFSKTDNGGLDE